MKAKFKVGDRVKCITNKTLHEGSSQPYGGCGWEKELIFKILEISNNGSGEYIYWKGKAGGGVYEDWLELCESKIKPFGIVKFCETHYV